jgi:hypothetical protein
MTALTIHARIAIVTLAVGAPRDVPDSAVRAGWRNRAGADAAAVTDETDLPTPRTTLASRFVRVLLTCWHCRHQADADLPALIAAGRGDVPLVRLRWCCARCRSGKIDMICTSRDRVMPWRPPAR